MPKIDLKRLSVADLVELRDQIQTALSGKITIERRELQEKIDALATLEANQSTPSNRGRPRHAVVTALRVARGSDGYRSARRANPAKGKKAAPKYRGPNGELWAGRGLAPRWLAALEKKGKKREAFLIAH